MADGILYAVAVNDTGLTHIGWYNAQRSNIVNSNLEAFWN